MKESISQSHALGLIVNNLSQPLRNLISSALVKSFIDLAERAECKEIGKENGTFDTIIKKPTSKSTHSVVASMTQVTKSKQTKATNKANTATSASKTIVAPNKQRPGLSYNRKFTPLEQSPEEIMGVLLQRCTLTLLKVSNLPPVIGRNNDQFYKYHRAPGHETKDFFVLKNIIQDAVDKELVGKEASSSRILKDPFPSHREGQAALVSILKIAAPINAKPLDFFGLFPDQMDSTSSIEESIPLIFFEPLEEILPSRLDSPSCPTFKVNTLLPLRIKQEIFEKKDIWNVGWYVCQPIIFTYDNLPVGVMHTSTLHLEVSVLGFSVSNVLIDGNASVNVFPLQTIQEIGIWRTQIELMIIDITRFYGHAQTPFGKVIVPVSVIPQDEDHMVEFYIIDVDTSYNMLLGRPWIHSQNAVASTLHQIVR
ncbi:unnamed protein product [Victoria cruziana]